MTTTVQQEVAKLYRQWVSIGVRDGLMFEFNRLRDDDRRVAIRFQQRQMVIGFSELAGVLSAGPAM